MFVNYSPKKEDEAYMAGTATFIAVLAALVATKEGV